MWARPMGGASPGASGLTPAHICTGAGPTSATSAPRLGPPLPHLRSDRVTTFMPGLDPPLPHLRRDCGGRARCRLIVVCAARGALCADAHLDAWAVVAHVHHLPYKAPLHRMHRPLGAGGSVRHRVLSAIACLVWEMLQFLLDDRVVEFPPDEPLLRGRRVGHWTRVRRLLLNGAPCR